MYKIIEYNDSMKEKVVEFILSILEGEFHHFGIDRPDIHNIPSFYQKNDGNFWVAFDDEKLVGTIGLIKKGENLGYIKRMAVQAEYRGKGASQELFHTLLDFATSHGYKNLYLATSQNMVAAQKFYEKEGFERVPVLPEGFDAPGDVIFYKKSLC